MADPSGPSGLRLDNRIAVLSKPPFYRWLLRRLGPIGANVVCYYVPRRRCWCIGAWKNRVTGTVAELFSWSHESEIPVNAAQHIRYLLDDRRRDDRLRYRRQWLAAKRQEKVRFTDESEEESKESEFYRKNPRAKRLRL